MKKIFKYFGVFLSVVLMGALTACSIKEDEGSADLGLGIKVFFPTKVVAGQPMTINGSGFSDVKEIVFPGGVSVTGFELVSGEMIRVTAPSGIAAEGGKLIVRSTSEEAQSSATLTLGNTVVSGYSKQEGETAEGGEQITVFGQDLEFISKVELQDTDGNPLILEDKDFYRKGTSSVIFTVPKKTIYEGAFVGKVYTIDGKVFNLPELTYKPASDDGHWEIVKKSIWKNDGSHGAISWSGEYRFAGEGFETGEEVYIFPADVWAKIKSETFYILLEATDPQIRVTTGWWTTNWTGDDIFPGNELLKDNEDGTFTLEVNISEDQALLDLVDVQHLLFTGDRYTLLEIFQMEEVWVEGGGDSGPKEVLIWENDGSHGAISWSSEYRFAGEGFETGEEIYIIPATQWSVIMNGTFYLQAAINADWYNLRITTGWWTTTWTGQDIGKGDERLIVSEDGTTFSLELHFEGDPILDYLDVQHLLFTGEGYTPLKLYFLE